MEKLSLVDYDGYCAAVLFTAGCPFRCPYCHNPSLIAGDVLPLDESEVLGHLDKRRGVLDAVVISGGEPTLNPGLPEFISRIKDLFGYKIKLDTSGVNPGMLERLIREKYVDYVAMDIKSGASGYGRAVGIPGYDPSDIIKSAEILRVGGVDYEFRTTLVAELHTEADMREIADIIIGAPRYCLQKFTDRGDCLMSGLHPVDKDTALLYAEIIKPYVKSVELRSY